MSKYEIFAKRNKTFKYDVLEYDVLPDKLRVQIEYIWNDALEHNKMNGYTGSEVMENFIYIRNYLCRELGIEFLYEGYERTRNFEECFYYLKKGQDIEILLSLIELSILSISRYREKIGGFEVSRLEMNQEEAIDELNHRFRESGFGYEFSNGKLIRKDSEILHKEVIKPALYLLQEQDFKGALDEFLQAHVHYRKGHHKESIINAGKAFESTMRTIGIKEAWGLTGKENASELIAFLVNNQVIPSYVQNTLQGLGTLRNNVAHGQGANATVAPEHLVHYALHLCGTNIVMLIEAYKAYKK